MSLAGIADKGAASLMERMGPSATRAAGSTGEAAVRMTADVGTFAATHASDIIKSLQKQVADLTGQVADLTGRLSSGTAQGGAVQVPLASADAKIGSGDVSKIGSGDASKIGSGDASKIGSRPSGKANPTGYVWPSQEAFDNSWGRRLFLAMGGDPRS